MVVLDDDDDRVEETVTVGRLRESNEGSDPVEEVAVSTDTALAENLNKNISIVSYDADNVLS